MHVHPEVEALRSNPASQRRSQRAVTQAVAEWREGGVMRALTRDVARYGEGASLAQCPALAELLRDRRPALDFARSFCSGLLASLRGSPLGEVQLRYRQSGGFSALQLLRHGRATLSLAAYERQPVIREPETARFIDVETLELVVSGSARGTLHRCIERGNSTQIETSKEHWQAGDRIRVCSGEARQIVTVDGSLLVLQLTRSPVNPVATREFAISDSRLLKVASGDKQASSDLMALGVLGAMEHQPALQVMGRIALDKSRDPDLRWEAVRQTLAQRPDLGIAMLGKLALHEGDPLTAPAADLRAQLLTAHPQLTRYQREAA